MAITDVQDLTIGVSDEGVGNYAGELCTHIYETVVNVKLKDGFTPVQDALDEAWQGQAKDNFIRNVRAALDKISEDLDLEAKDLIRKLTMLEKAYFDQDANMIQ